MFNEDSPLPITEKVYTDRMISVASFFGGPMAAGLLLSQNFRTLEKQGHALKTLVGAIVLCVILIPVFLFVPALQNAPNWILSIAYLGLAVAVYGAFQKNTIDAHLEQGGLTHSWWKVIGMALVGLALYIGLFMILLIAFTAVGLIEG